MKKYLIFMMLAVFVYSRNVEACEDVCKSTCNTSLSSFELMVVNAGKALDNVSVPGIGKLTNLLPFAVVSFCLQTFPKQTVALAGTGVAYCLYKNDVINKCLDWCRNHGTSPEKSAKKMKQQELLNDDFFVFNEEDEEIDAQDDSL